MVGPSGIATGVVRGGLAAGWLATGAFTARNDVIRAVEPARLSAPALWGRGPGVSAPPPVAASQLERPVGGGADTPGPRTHNAGAGRRAGSTARMTSFLAVNAPVASQPAASPPRTTPEAMPPGPTIRDHREADSGSPHSAHRAVVGQNGPVSDIPRRTVARTAKLASLPLGMAGRATMGVGKRIGGKPAEMVATELQQRTAEQVFQVLGQLKGGAMKFGQALSVFEAALPEEVAAPYRAALTKLQEAAPPMAATAVHRVLATELGPGWRALFREFNDRPAAAASIGQVHRAVWTDGTPVAVKVQYPGAGPALMSDLNQLGRLARIFGAVVPGLDVKPLIAELKVRAAEELEYLLEAESQRAFAAAYDGDPDICVPQVLDGAESILVTEWIDGIPLSQVIRDGSPEDRNRAGLLLVKFLYSCPGRVGLLHADPHPGNFRLLADGRLGVIDFGAVNRLPDGVPDSIGRLARLALDGDARAVLEGLRAEGFVKPGVVVDPAGVLDYISPLLAPLRTDTFHFSRPWLRSEAVR